MMLARLMTASGCLTLRCACCTGLLLGSVFVARGTPPTEPLSAPTYSFDISSPTVDVGYVDAGSVLELDFPYPQLRLSRELMGLYSPLDDLDALSVANTAVDEVDTFALLFSVDRLTEGVEPPAPLLVSAGIPYNVLDQADRGHAAGDQFFSTESFSKFGPEEPSEGTIENNSFLSRNNFDEGGTDFSAVPNTHAHTQLPEPTPRDRVDAMAQLGNTARDDVPEGLYFSVTSASPSLDLLPYIGQPSGADIFYFAVTGSENIGPCCLAEGGCEVLSLDDCMAGGGSWLGPDFTCDMCEEPPAEEGACCFFDGTCEITEPQLCPSGVAVWLGPQTTCDMCQEPPAGEGACCFEDGTCEILEIVNCMALQGYWLGADSTCDQCEEPQTESGACCLHNGGCEIAPPELCPPAIGVWLGPDTTCEMCEEPPAEEGACCFIGEACQIIDVQTCYESRGDWLGPGTSCEMCAGRPDQVMLFASHADLGLDPWDDIDALIVFDVNENGYFDDLDQVLFSLTPESPSLLTIAGASVSGAAADIFVALPGQMPALFAPAEILGLGASADNVDALDLYVYGTGDRTITQFGIRTLVGDVNADDVVNLDDIDAFVQALAGQASFLQTYPDGHWINADCNRDGVVNCDDIDAFVAILTCGPRAGSK